MKVFISGGCKNGKSTYGENIAVYLAKSAKPLYYIATMLPVDEEDKERIERHRLSRKGLGFKTIEIGRDIANITDICNMQGTFFLDSATALLANEMFLADGTINTEAHINVADGILKIMEISTNIVVISDFIFSDANIYDDYTEAYRKGLAYVDRKCATASDIVLEICYGGMFVHKGRELLNEIAF